ncbi:hypothetical protein MPTK1_6g05610 [Marchantia polymorpha subsp. ruderalis]|uniref:Uncharacterized protein n=2 Tax=Marchantia polymorpha TaxID=3197 RepID=A0AAF6BNV6_MARPO|nr:hypothetical protein MARPO_0097s0081 [Marchantia polymorpha]BBN13690.1 hypothetical protein Mp_6g05610 [Marchantia polymorpha subsp. ruderalis]|eukprot:PTQ32620.1 hypothetical protein MARPO_0097s0081 [Marchantia polymorpha]
MNAMYVVREYGLHGSLSRHHSLLVDPKGLRANVEEKSLIIRETEIGVGRRSEGKAEVFSLWMNIAVCQMNLFVRLHDAN